MVLIIYKNMLINKEIQFIGEGREIIIIDGNKSGNGIHITANDINFSEFKQFNQCYLHKIIKY